MQSVMQACEVGLEALRDGDLTRAESVFDQVLAQANEPDVNVFLGYGTVLVAQQRFALGAMLLQIAAQMRPDIHQIWTNLGCALKFLGKDEAALTAYERSLSIKPGEAETLAAIAGFWINKNAAAKCEEFAREALASDPANDAAHMHLGMALLEQGRFDEAWPHYERRWETLERRKDKRPYNAPRWIGKRVGTLAIHGEQGLGDEIMFMGALAEASRMADRIVVECAERLIPLFRRSFGVPCYATHAELIEAEGEPDAYIPMGSLFGVLGIPDGAPYLPRRKSRFNRRPLVGVAWQGGTLKTARSTRTLELEALRPILDAPGVDFVSVQYGPDEVDEQARKSGLQTMPNREFDTIHQTISDCDLIISVPQTAVHQAGAMGVPCWVLTPSMPSWPFAGTTSQMRFYRSVELFRQASEDTDWHYTIQNVANALRERYARAA